MISVKEGINLPRYPRCPGGCGPSAPPSSGWCRMRGPTGCGKPAHGCRARESRRAEVLGTGADAVPALVALLDELGVLP